MDDDHLELHIDICDARNACRFVAGEYLCAHGYLRSGEGIAAARLHLGDDGGGRSDSLH